MLRLLSGLVLVELSAVSIVGCSHLGSPDASEAARLKQGMSVAQLYAPKVDGKRASRWMLQSGGEVTLSWAGGSGRFRGTLTLSKSRKGGDLCAGRAPQWDDCEHRGSDAALLRFEELNALVVRRGGEDLLWSDFSLEGADEDFASRASYRAWQERYVGDLISSARSAEPLDAAEFVRLIPHGRFHHAG